MKRIKVIVDSTGNLSPEIARQYDMRIIPLHIQFGMETFRDGVDMPRAEFHQRIAAGVFPKTSQPPVGVFAEMFTEEAATADGIICFTVTGAHSGTYGSALAATQMVPGPRIEIVDSRCLSFGTGLHALAAARAAQQGKSMDDILKIVAGVRSRMQHFMSLSTLKYLQMGGRVSTFQSVFASLLNVKPILYVKDGTLTPYERVRTRSRSIERMLELMTQAVGDQPVRLGIVHDSALEEAQQVLETLKKRINVQESFVDELDLALTCHSGPHMVGVIGYAVGPDET
jgi:DegV family protein with EDD domain